MPSPKHTASDLEAGNPEHELAAHVALIRAGVIRRERLGEMIDNMRSAVEMVRLSDRDELVVNGSQGVLGGVTPEDIDRAIRDVRSWRQRNLDVRSVLDSTYPTNLHSIFNRPALVFISGEWDDALDQRSIAVVGTRKPSTEGLKRARRVSRELAEAQFTVMSGMARGIDTAAHSAALKAKGRTVAVMGTGLDVRYPKENIALADAIIESGGALLSQFFPWQHPARWTFPMRNVVMSGLSLATVVVEAGATSGARMQARVALQHGRAVFLLRSLVEEHDWARKYVSEGVYDTQAIEITSTSDIVDRIDLVRPLDRPLAV